MFAGKRMLQLLDSGKKVPFAKKSIADLQCIQCQWVDKTLKTPKVSCWFTTKSTFFQHLVVTCIYENIHATRGILQKGRQQTWHVRMITSMNRVTVLSPKKRASVSEHPRVVSCRTNEACINEDICSNAAEGDGQKMEMLSKERGKQMSRRGQPNLGFCVMP